MTDAEQAISKSSHAASDAVRRGFAHLNAGRAHEAAACCREALTIDPKHIGGHFLVGLAATDLGDWRTAARAFATVTRLDPRHGAAHAQQARALIAMGMMGPAKAALDRARAEASDDPPVCDLIGVCLSLLGDQAGAARSYAQALKGAPEQSAYAVNHATALMYLGDNARALEALAPTLARDPLNPQAQWLKSSLRRAEARGEADALIAAAHEADGSARAFLAYAAGKDFEDLGLWDAAFDAFDLGASAKRAAVDYDELAEIDAFESLHGVFGADWATTLRGGVDDQAPIFIFGQPRTGTTLIERIVASHPNVASAGELQQFGLSVRRMVGGGRGRWSADVARASARLDPKTLGEAYLAAVAPVRPATPRFVDKLPGNFAHLPLILAALPNAQIVHVVREPLDACVASYKQLFADAYLHSYEQTEMARHFARYHRLMAHWRAVFPGRFLDVSYEATVRDLEPSARRLIAYLDLDWNDACLAFHEQAGAVATASAVQVREKAHTRSVGRWRRYAHRLAPMRAALKAQGVCGDGLDGAD